MQKRFDLLIEFTFTQRPLFEGITPEANILLFPAQRWSWTNFGAFAPNQVIHFPICYAINIYNYHKLAVG